MLSVCGGSGWVGTLRNASYRQKSGSWGIVWWTTIFWLLVILCPSSPPPFTLPPHPPILLPSLGPKGASTISSPAPGSLINSPGGSRSPSAGGGCHWGRPQAAVPSSLLQDTGSRRGRVSAAPALGPAGWVGGHGVGRCSEGSGEDAGQPASPPPPSLGPLVPPTPSNLGKRTDTRFPSDLLLTLDLLGSVSSLVKYGGHNR